MATERVRKIKEHYDGLRPCISAERLVLIREAYQKYAGSAIPIFRAQVFAYILEHKHIFISDGELIVGNQANKERCAPIYPEYSAADWILDGLDEFPTRKYDPFQVTEEDKEVIRKELPYWENKSIEKELENLFDDETNLALDLDVFTLGGRDCSQAHTMPDHDKLLRIGLNGIIAICEENIRATGGGSKEAQEKIDFWNAAIIACKGVIRYAERHALLAEDMAAKETDAVRKQELLDIAKTCRKVPGNPPETFREAIQMVWFIHLMPFIETNSTGNGFGRFDQYMYPFYSKDVKKGIISDEDVKELIELLFIKINTLVKLRPHLWAKCYAGYTMWQILMVGGQTVEGLDASNQVSFLTLEAADELRMAQPAVAMRYFDGISPELFDKALNMIQRGLANPAFFNDKVCVPVCMAKGGTLEEARDWAVIGCIEPHPGGGTSDASPLAGYMNALKCFELVMHNGVDPVSGKMVGVETGDPATFTTKEQFMEAVEKQMFFFWDKLTSGFNKVVPYHMLRLPAIFSSLVIDGSIEKGMSVQQGGAKYNYTGTYMCGIANVTDCIAAIDKLVLKDKVLTIEEINKACACNFEGYERMRQMLLKKADKFGNDVKEVDDIAREITSDCADYVQSKKDSRGGQYNFGSISQTQNVRHGEFVGATPDGRLAGTPLCDNSSPAMGRDVAGPTATVNSVSHMDQSKFYHGALFNMRFDPKGVEGKKGREIIGGVVKTYFENYGEHIQINVVSDKMLRDAQENPENYRNLIVRVAGYMACFTDLEKSIQDSIIERTAHLSA